MAGPPSPADVWRMGHALRRGSAIDAPKSLLALLRELAGNTPADSPLTMRTLMCRADYRDLTTPKLRPGDPAFDFELPRYDFTDGAPTATGATVRLSAFRDVQPVALIFGSYT